MSSPRPSSPLPGQTTASTTARPSSPKPPGGPATAIRRKAAADRADKAANARPSSTRAAGAGGSSSTMLRLYTDESPGLKVDPVVVLVLSVGFIISVVALHGEFSLEEEEWMGVGVVMEWMGQIRADGSTVIAKITRKFSS
ncbi:Arf guanine nucleotide exchange factor sbh1 [Coniosporium apollinis]|uniref:Arf guanine nucleotide exchange factor sbh1 n=1 Tax=Coniosporium apollinis TaxID=61459 RepID=A0ABQ9NZA2_9PEZI|nr:Arf guanine nucleotide exchange factor sbh1 [Coniosporium apollinis]